MVASYNLLVIEFNTSRHMYVFYRIRVQKLYSIPYDSMDLQREFVEQKTDDTNL